MIAGKLNETITIVRPETVKDSYGATNTVWDIAAVTKAYVVQNNGVRSVVNNEIFNNYTVEFGIRFYHNIDEKCRIIWNNKKYQIESIVSDRIKNHKIIITTLINE